MLRIFVLALSLLLHACGGGLPRRLSHLALQDQEGQQRLQAPHPLIRPRSACVS